MSWNGLTLNISIILFIAVIDGIVGEDPEKIIGGTNVHNIEHYPFVCSIRLKGVHVCGCSIISEHHIITAAHCVQKLQLSKSLQICTGDHRFEKGQQLHNVSQIISHPDFSSSRKYKPINDIAVIKLERPIQFNEYQQIIRLPTTNPPVNVETETLGWGTIKPHKSHWPEVLQKTKMMVLDNDECYSMLGIRLTDSTFCAYEGLGRGCCHGDSGGPLIHNNQLSGISIAVFLPCGHGSPDLYTNVYHFKDFIRECMSKM